MCEVCERDLFRRNTPDLNLFRMDRSCHRAARTLKLQDRTNVERSEGTDARFIFFYYYYESFSHWTQPQIFCIMCRGFSIIAVIQTVYKVR